MRRKISNVSVGRQVNLLGAKVYFKGNIKRARGNGNYPYIQGETRKLTPYEVSHPSETVKKLVGEFLLSGKGFKKLNIQGYSVSARDIPRIYRLLEKMMSHMELNVVAEIPSRKIASISMAQSYISSKKKKWKNSYTVKESKWKGKPAVFIHDKGRFVGWFLKGKFRQRIRRA